MIPIEVKSSAEKQYVSLDEFLKKHPKDVSTMPALRADDGQDLNAAVNIHSLGLAGNPSTHNWRIAQHPADTPTKRPWRKALQRAKRSVV